MAQRMRVSSRAQALYARGVQEVQCGQLRQAALTLQQVIFFAPDDARPVVALAECYVHLCDLQSAVRHYRRALWLLQRQHEQHDDCDDSGAPALAASPPSLDADVVRRRLGSLLDALGMTLFHLSDFAQALRFANEALDLYSSHTRNDDRNDDCNSSSSNNNNDDDDASKAVVALHACVYLIALQRDEEAEHALETRLRRGTAHAAQVAALLVQLYCNRQAFRAARLLLERQDAHARNAVCVTVARHLFHTTYTRYRAKALRERDLGTISRCIEVYDNDVDLLFTRAQLLIASGQHKRSVRDLFRCIQETNGGHAAAVETMTSVLFTIGATLDSRAGIREAVAYYSESLKWRSDNTLVLRARGDCYVKLDDYASALQDYRRIVSIDPDDRTATRRMACLHDWWGCQLHARGRLVDAEREFSNAIRVADDDAVFYYHRAMCRFALGERRYALRDVLSCQQLHPTQPELRAFLVRFLGSSDAAHATTSSTTTLPRVWHDARGKPHLQHDAAAWTAATRAAQRRAAALYGGRDGGGACVHAARARHEPPQPLASLSTSTRNDDDDEDNDNGDDDAPAAATRASRRMPVRTTRAAAHAPLPSLLCGTRSALAPRSARARHVT